MGLVRTFFAVLFVACVVLLSVGYYIQYADGLLPCTLCIFQRVAYAATGVIALLGVIIPYRRNGFRVIAFFGLLTSLAGVGLAWRQVWLQHQPLDPNAPCMPGLSYLFQVFSFPRALGMALQGTADCGQIRWTLWSLSMAEWSLVCFVGLALGMLLTMCWQPKKI
ncbi:MAG: disulfide bond formation protein B [Coxiellaceae bacterium]|nr:disulfide bond formation protein B [Coxiellaceae bacterium]